MYLELGTVLITINNRARVRDYWSIYLMKPELGTDIDLIGPELGTGYLRTFFLTPALIAES